MEDPRDRQRGLWPTLGQVCYQIGQRQLFGQAGLLSELCGFLRRSPLIQGFIAGLFLFCAAVACSWTCYLTARDAYRQRIVEDLSCLAQLAADLVDPTQHAMLTRPDQQNGPAYLALVNPLRKITEDNHELRYIYTIRPSSEGPKFVLDTGLPADTDKDGLIDQAALGEVYLDSDPELLQALKTGKPSVTQQPYRDKWGEFFTAYAPVKRADGQLEAILGIDMDARDFRYQCAAMQTSLALSCGVALLASSLVGWGFALYQRARKTYLTRIAESEQRYALAIQGSNDGLWDWDLRSKTIYLSDRFRAMHGVEASPVQRRQFLSAYKQTIHPADQTRVRTAIYEHLAGRAPFDVEYRARVASGGYRWFRAKGQVIRDHEGLAVRMAGSLSDVTDRVKLQGQLRKAARIDRLTGLPNRSGVLERLRRAIRRRQPGQQFGLLFLDFDRFKVVNDSLGHEAGDTLLRSIAERLRRNLRAGDGILGSGIPGTAARLGGDEFVVILEGLKQPSDATAVAHRLLEVLSEPYTIGSSSVVSTASVGIVLGDETYQRAEDLLRDADTAMYEAKTARRGTFALFDATMRERVKRRMTLEQGLRSAFDEGRLSLEYQPIVCLQTARLESLEALVRWEHPTLGRIDPSEFIPLAEECGLIVALGQRVLEMALDQLSRWRNKFPASRLPGLSVNLARQQLLVPGLARQTARAVTDRGLDPSEILLEITEGAMMTNPSAAGDALRALRQTGFRLAIDDFGTGYSSLACLHQFPFEFLKVDRSFVDGLGKAKDREAIVQTITAMAKVLGIRVIAEGVETAEQLTMLRQLGCNHGQGYIFAKPMPPSAMEAWLESPRSIIGPRNRSERVGSPPNNELPECGSIDEVGSASGGAFSTR